MCVVINKCLNDSFVAENSHDNRQKEAPCGVKNIDRYFFIDTANYHNIFSLLVAYFLNINGVSEEIIVSVLDRMSQKKVQ